jgi:predicted phosphate transport protein (TIGR00153 family)
MLQFPNFRDVNRSYRHKLPGQHGNDSTSDALTFLLREHGSQVMAILTNLFGESPFGALEGHGEKVHECVRLVKALFVALEAGNTDELMATAERIFQLESEADKIRNHVHELLSAKVLMPMAKGEFFNILEQQDSMADRAEDIAAALTARNMTLPSDVFNEVQLFVDVVLKNCNLAAGIMSKLDLLVESSFSGRDALTVSKLITELSEREDDVKPMQISLSRRLLKIEPELSPVESMLWLEVIHHLTELSKCADRTGNGMRMTLRPGPAK